MPHLGGYLFLGDAFNGQPRETPGVWARSLAKVFASYSDGKQKDTNYMDGFCGESNW